MNSQGGKEEGRTIRKRKKKKKRKDSDCGEVSSLSRVGDMECKTESIVCNANRNLDDILQVWKDACTCQKTVYYEQQIERLLETIELLKYDVTAVKTENAKLTEENENVKKQMKRLKELNQRQKRTTSVLQNPLSNQQAPRDSIADAHIDQSTDPKADCTWLFPTEQWLNSIENNMNPSTDSENFETTMAKEGNDQLFSADCFFEGDDEVFNGMDETEGLEKPGCRETRQSRVRRISDVIDSIGESPSYLTRDKTFSFPTIDTFKLQSPPKGRPKSSVTDGPISPPATPSSDLGYMSTGTPTTPSNYLLKKKTFRYSASSVETSASPPRWDTQLDAKAFAQSSSQAQYESSVIVKPTASMPAEKCSRIYNMSHKKRGLTLIFNHEEFKDMPPREGSGVDVKRLECAFKNLDFEVNVYQDLPIEKLKVVINEVSVADHRDEDCLVVIVLTHGLGSGLLMAQDYAYPVEHLWTPFAGDKCLSLAGKPKLFFIQACRGEKLDGGLTLVSRTQVDNSVSNYKIPSMADFLLAFSTFEGHYSWRNPEKGTWFIQSLCEVLEEEGTKSSLQEILLEVSRRVATNYESYNDFYAWQHEQKQVPQINSTLLRHVYFTPKECLNKD